MVQQSQDSSTFVASKVWMVEHATIWSLIITVAISMVNASTLRPLQSTS
jgi:hypothetical protein